MGFAVGFGDRDPDAQGLGSVPRRVSDLSGVPTQDLPYSWALNARKVYGPHISNFRAWGEGLKVDVPPYADHQSPLFLN